MTESFWLKDGLVKSETTTPFHDDQLGDRLWFAVEYRLGSQVIARAGCPDGMSSPKSFATHQALDVLTSAIEQIFRESSGVYGCDESKRKEISDRILAAGRYE